MPVETWFTTEWLDADTCAISEYRHWEETHCYLLIGQKSALLIDTGLGVGDISALAARLTDQPRRRPRTCYGPRGWKARPWRRIRLPSARIEARPGNDGVDVV